MSTDGAPQASAEPEVLRLNPGTATTRIVERVRVGTPPRVRKGLQPPTPDVPASGWSGSTDPRRWDHWPREAEVYADPEVRAGLAGTGIELPACEVQRTADGVVLLMEDVDGVPGSEFTIEDHAAFCTALGTWQGSGPPGARGGGTRVQRANNGRRGGARPGSCATTPAVAASTRPSSTTTPHGAGR